MVFGQNMGKTRLPVVILLLLIALYWRHHGELGHLLRKDPSDIAKEVLFWRPEGKRQRGRSRTRWRR